MKIVHYFDHVNLERGGTIRAALDMCRVFGSRGHDVTLATFDPTDVPAEWTDGTPAPEGTWPKVEVIAPPPLPAEFYPPGGPKAMKAIIEGADVVHLTACGSPPRPRSAESPTGWACRRCSAATACWTTGRCGSRCPRRRPTSRWRASG